MSTVAQAVVVSSPGTLDVASVTLGHIGPRDVLIRTEFSGVSTGTDKWVMQGRFTWSALTFPAVPGYQRFGIVEALGDEVTGFEIGQQVVATESRPFDDARASWGAHASLAATDYSEVYDASGVLPERASLFISAQVGFNAASRIPDDPQRVVVYGDGVIGVSAALSARARGFEVLVVGRHIERLEPVLGPGITSAPSGDAALVRDWQPTAVIDTVQSDAAFDEYADALPQRTGLIVFSGHSPDKTKHWADMERMQQRELTAAFVSGWAPDRIAATLELMRGEALPLERLAQVSAGASIAPTMRDVAAGSLTPLAAVLDWR